MSSLTTCYLVGGAPLSGKTTLASILAVRHQAVQISTDNIREWMWKLTRPEDYPLLFSRRHNGRELDVEEYYKIYTPKDVVRSQIKQGKDVDTGIRAVIGSELPWERLVIEGIAITPESVLALKKNFPKIHFETTFLFDDNAERITKRIHERGLWGPAGTYPGYITDKEVEWVILYNEFYKAEAQRHNLPLLPIDSLQSE
jgi:2-phosphoglycerate kinase